MEYPKLTIKDITNNNLKNNPTQDVYDAFNSFMFSEDRKVLGKLLHRFEWFLKTKDLPGDVIEGGCFRGSGVSTFTKFIDIYCPNSNKKVIGFDIFDTVSAQKILGKDNDIDKTSMNVVYDRVPHNELSLDSVTKNILNTKISTDKFQLVAGDVEQTLPIFIKENPGLRISLLYIDFDIENPTYYMLKYLWDRILPGGVVLFDEFEYHKFTESNGVERFLKEKGLSFDLKSTNWIAPTAYMIKKGF